MVIIANSAVTVFHYSLSVLLLLELLDGGGGRSFNPDLSDKIIEVSKFLTSPHGPRLLGLSHSLF